ncbi:RNA-dependent RNA polymerase 1 [Hypsizygus marmoreus]|uniref:RNA-dependent RNA polymerase n=1 Tax=Hypsizygus marmoreus TaxID=39966 RepID=A0A369KAC8_HYPMA|nr:RNA-dependent RNA polymerase 1 [Hypsizygus marmoreus]
MEIFMRNISYGITHYQLTTALADIFHRPPYTGSSSLPLNFDVHLFQDKRNPRKHKGSGALTLPTIEDGVRFLQEYGGDNFLARQCIINGRRIHFLESKRPVRPEVVESLRRRPYLDPKALEDKKILDDRLTSEKVAFRTIQFGWQCRDSVLSIEWEETVENGGLVSFDDDRRELRITIPHSPNKLIVAVRFSQIRTSSVHTYLSNEPVILLFLDMPPAFESEDPAEPVRQRLAALPIGDHVRVAPYASLAVRLICSSPRDMSKFLDLAKAVRLHSISDLVCQVDHRGLFSAAAVEELEDWLRRLNWCISFQIESLVRSLSVDIKEMLTLLPRIRQLIGVKGKHYMSLMLRHFAPRARELFWDPYDDEAERETIEQCFCRVEEQFAIHANLATLRPTDASLFEAYHVTITPTTMFLDGPYPERSNRVIRLYDSIHHESFLRVSFLDEARLQYRFDRDIDGPAFIRSRVGHFLLNGLTIARRHFEFLAYSQSALKEHAVWFVKPFRDVQRGYVNAEKIIESLGSFDKLKFDPDLMRCPARYGARIAQAFTATDASVTIKAIEEIFYLDDIKAQSGNYYFTDGVGTMSKELAVEISRELKSKRRKGRSNKIHPSAFQVRFMGSKGMLSVDYKLSGRAICLRKSMIKFEAPDSTEVEIARAFDRPGAYYLNRPLIMLLEGLGVEYDVFKQFQDKAVQETQESTQSLAHAARMLESHGLGSSFRLPSVMLSLAKLGIDDIYGSLFYQKMLQFAVNHVLRELKNHSRIPVPGGWTLVGVADVHRYLQEGQIFACVKPLHGRKIYLEGPILISRSPTIHPGDVQIVNAIGSPPEGSCFASEALPNTVVFSVLGSRPLPSYLGGGDLDGDVYNLLPLNDLPEFTPQKTCSPAIYAPTEKKLVNHSGPSTMTDVAEFVMEYINSDIVGIIAINWLILADQSPEGIFNKACLTLAQLHSDAVDYPKSGNPVLLSAVPKLLFREKPDWNAPETVNPDSAKYYDSKRAIGRLFRAIDLPTPNNGSTSRRRRPRLPRNRVTDELSDALASLSVEDTDQEIIHDIVEVHVSQFLDVYADPDPGKVESIGSLFYHYVSELQSICADNTLAHTRTATLTEEEAVVGTIVQKTSQPRKRKDMMSKLREQTDVLVRGIREELAGDEGTPLEEFLEGAWLAWKLSILERASFGGESFGWVALGAIFEAIKDIEGAQLEESRSRFY